MEEGELSQIDTAIALISSKLRGVCPEPLIQIEAASIVIGNVRHLQKKVTDLGRCSKTRKRHEVEIFRRIAEHPPEDGCLISPGIAPILKEFVKGKITLSQMAQLLSDLEQEYESYYKERGYMTIIHRKPSVASG